MSISKNTREKDEYLDKTIKQLLNIKDANIRFSKEAVSKEKVNGRMANIFTGILTYKVDRCPQCGFTNLIRHSYKGSWIQLIPYQEVPQAISALSKKIPY